MPEANDTERDVEMMGRAITLAREASFLGEVPVGAVLTHRGRIIAQAFNLRETLHDPTAHAERLVLTIAGRSLGSWRMDECTLYVTLEPCPMCRRGDGSGAARPVGLRDQRSQGGGLS